MDYANKEYGYYSDCCGAYVIWTDICSECKEHCDPIYEEDEEEDE